MAIQVRATASASDSTDGGVTVTVPSGVVAGDLLVAVVGFNDPTSVVTHPTGWTVVEALVGQGGGTEGGGTQTYVCTRLASSADAGSSVTWGSTITGGKEVVSLVALYSSVSGQSVGVAASNILGQLTTDTNLLNPTISVDELPATLFAGCHKKGGTAGPVITPPSGWTQQGDSPKTTGGGANAVAVATVQATTTGAQTQATWTTDTSSSNGAAAILVLVEEAPPPPPEMLKPVARRWNGVSWTLVS